MGNCIKNNDGYVKTRQNEENRQVREERIKSETSNRAGVMRQEGRNSFNYSDNFYVVAAGMSRVASWNVHLRKI